MLLAAVALVLVVATANLANAMLAKGMAREAELAIRRAIGGSAGQLARQLLGESTIVGAAGGALGAAAAAFLLPLLLSLIPFGYVPAEAQVVLDWRVVAAATACAVGCGLLIGLMPALRAAAIDPATLLKHADTRTGSGRRHHWRDAFAAAQLILAIVVLGVAASAWASLRDAVTRDPGYRAAGIWTARIALPSAAAASRDSDDVYARILRRPSTRPSGPQPPRLAQTRRAVLGPKLLAVTLLGVFGAAVLALSSVGIYAVVSQPVQERAQELRIRLTFGAAPRQLFVAELRRAGGIVIVSAVVGASAAVAALRLLAATFAGFTGPIALPLAASTALLIVLALAATAVPAYQACRLDALNRT